MTHCLKQARQRWDLWLVGAQLWKDAHGQDLVEYSLMAGFVAVSAGAIMPSVANSISTVFNKVASVMTKSATQGS
jgi:Flp pilus assembly pilin Flp